MDPLTFDVSRRDHRVVVAVSGELDMTGVLRLEPALAEIVSGADVRELTLDLTDLTAIDSMAMALLIETHGAARHNGLELRLRRGLAGARPVVRVGDIEQALGARGECPRQESNLEPSD